MLQQFESVFTSVDDKGQPNQETLDALTAVELDAIAGGAVICNDH